MKHMVALTPEQRKDFGLDVDAIEVIFVCVTDKGDVTKYASHHFKVGDDNGITLLLLCDACIQQIANAIIAPLILKAMTDAAKETMKGVVKR